MHVHRKDQPVQMMARAWQNSFLERSEVMAFVARELRALLLEPDVDLLTQHVQGILISIARQQRPQASTCKPDNVQHCPLPPPPPLLPGPLSFLLVPLNNFFSEAQKPGSPPSPPALPRGDPEVTIHPHHSLHSTGLAGMQLYQRFILSAPHPLPSHPSSP